jgi:UPF0755 protein
MSGGRNRRDPNLRYSNVPRRHAASPRSPAETLEPGYAPPPPQRAANLGQHPVFKVFNIIITLVLVGVFAFAGLYFYIRAQFDSAGPLDYPTVVVIPKGEGVRQIAARLEREGVISDRLIFIASSVLYFRVQNKLKAGEYAIKKHATMREVLDTLVDGKAILYSVSVPEGLTSYQIVQRLNASKHLSGRVSMIPPEGSLLPDTYRFSRGTSRTDLIARMTREQERFVDEIWADRSSGLPFQNKKEAITLASIVEKESGRVDERDRIAAVYINRLKNGKRLESDPTIIYGLSGGKGSLGRPISKADMRQMTPYNTYRNGGLPPTPITNPGRAALEAVMRPAKTQDLFFVADGTGGHVFAETFEDHKKNVAKWRVIEKKYREAQAKKAAEEAKAQAEAEAAKAKAEQANGTAANNGKPNASGVAVTSSSSNTSTTNSSSATSTVPTLPSRNP